MFKQRALFLKDCLGLDKPDRNYHINAQDINPSTGKAYAVRPDGIWDDNYFDKNYGAQNRTNAAEMGRYDDLAKNTPKTADFAAGLDARENSAFGDYLGYLKEQDSPLDFYTKVSEAQGIPQMRKTQSTLQGQIYDLEDTLRRIEPDVSANSRNSMVTESQRRGIVTEKSKPIVENLGWIGQSLGRVSSAITEGNRQALDLTQLNEQGQQRFIDAYKTKLELATQQGTRALQAYTHDIDQSITITLAKIHRGEQISDQEKQNAFELLKLKTSAEYEIQKTNAANAANPKDRYISVGDKSSLYDTQTGKFISGGGGTPKGSGGGSTTYIPSSSKPTSSPTNNSYGVNPAVYNYLFGK